MLACACADGQIALLRVGEGARPRTLSVRKERISSVCFEPDGRLLLSAGFRGLLCVHDTVSGALVQQLPPHFGGRGIDCVRFAPSGAFVAVAQLDDFSGAPSPVEINPAAKQVICAIIARGNGSEHSPDPRRLRRHF